MREVLLVVRTFTREARTLRPGLERLDQQLGDSVLRVDPHHRTSADLAMFLCQLDLRGMQEGDPLDRLAERMRALGGELIDLATIDPDHATRLRQRILPRCEVKLPPVGRLIEATDALLMAIGPAVAPTTARREQPPRLRFRRGDGWEVGRLGRITDDRLYVVTSGPLRAGERTVIEISAPSVSASLDATVIEDAECIAPGTWGFAVRLTPTGPRRPSDQNVLTWAKLRLAEARALPSRAEHRIPLAWPAHLRDSRREHVVTVRDVSRGGVFAEMPQVPEGSMVRLRIPFDLGDAPLELAGEVARVVNRELAAHHGVPVGVGLRIRPVSRDSERYPAFVDRITQRAARHVVIGAHRPRLAELTRHFASVGYLTTGCDDLRLLLHHIVDGVRAPEVVLLDSDFAAPDKLRPRLLKRNLAVLAIHGNPITARRLVDAALLE